MARIGSAGPGGKARLSTALENKKIKNKWKNENIGEVVDSNVIADVYLHLHFGTVRN
jgi:hypothetical protein